MSRARYSATYRQHFLLAEPALQPTARQRAAVAQYPARTGGGSGKMAYRRYGKVALTATHSLSAKLLFVGRYQQVLIGKGGDPAVGVWDECALMQYPGRQTFSLMTSLCRYRKALPHRQAGLTAQGQALTVSLPDADFVWRH